MNRRIALRCVGWACLTYGIFVVVAWFLADGRVYVAPPPTYSADDPTLVRLRVDGERLVLRHTSVDRPRATVIFAHGNGGDLGPRPDPMVDHLVGLGLDVVAFDYRGYGRSEGEPSEDGTYADIDAVYRYVVDDLGVDPAHVLVVGHSLGGGPAAWLAEHRRVGGLLLSSTFTTAFETAVPGWLLPFDRYPTEDRLADIQVPVAVIHGDRDEVIDVELGRALFASAREPKRLAIVSGAGHQDVIDRDPAAYDALVEWLLSRAA